MAKLQKRHIEYLNDPIFLKKYLEILNNRLIYSNNRIEYDTKEMDKLYDYANVETLEDNYKAFNILLNNLNTNNTKLTEELIISIANTINAHAMYISNNYRKTGAGVKLNEIFPIEHPDNIDKKMKELLEKYYNEWSKLDIFEREALFNQEFIRIHPFEDGNGRTSRLLLNYNIILSGHAPVLIPAELREAYFEASNRNDINWIKELFETESKKELQVLDRLIENYEKEKTTKKR